jgi:plastocyanin
MRRTLLLLFAALALGLFAAGCGSDDESSSEPAASQPAETQSSGSGGGDVVTVAMKNIQFDPKTVTVDPGQTIRWENLDTVDHDVVATEGDGPKSDTFGKGGTYEFTPKTAGTIQYECTLHPGMVGTIEVR